MGYVSWVLIVTKSYAPRTHNEPQDAKGNNDLKEARNCECRGIVVCLDRDLDWVIRMLTALCLPSRHGPLPDGNRWLFDRRRRTEYNRPFPVIVHLVIVLPLSFLSRIE